MCAALYADLVFPFFPNASTGLMPASKIHTVTATLPHGFDMHIDAPLPSPAFRAITRIALLACAGICWTACSTQQHATHHVEKAMILPPGAQRLEHTPNQRFIMAAPIRNALPEFPLDVAAGMRATICVEFVVSEDGAVDLIRQIEDSPGCDAIDTAASTALMPHVRNAVADWTFFGAAICTYRLNETECDGDDAVITPIPITLAYEFKFSSTDGRIEVDTRVR